MTILAYNVNILCVVLTTIPKPNLSKNYNFNFNLISSSLTEIEFKAKICFKILFKLNSILCGIAGR